MLISNITTTKDKRIIIISRMVYEKKIIFDTLQKMMILNQFLQQKTEYSVMLLLAIYVFIHMMQFLLEYDYIHTYQIYKNILLFYYFTKDNSYEKYVKIPIVIAKCLQNIKTCVFGM